MTKPGLYISVLSLLMALWGSSGCGGGGGARVQQVLPGMTVLQVVVRAEAKTGWNDPRNDSTYTGLRPGEAKSFETTDYSAIDQIIVWVEPAPNPAGTIQASSAGNIVINLGATRTDLIAAGRGSIWDFRNATGRVEEVFLRDESGKVTPLGRVAGPGRSVTPNAQGLVDVMIASRPTPVARVYIAPSAYVRVASSKQPVNFVLLPPGRAKVVAWHERLPGSSVEVDVIEGKTTQAALAITVNSLPPVP